METTAKQICFVDMPFGKKADPGSGIEIDFDQIYSQGIKPAIEAAGLAPVRGDQEQTGGIIHTAMFARLLLAEFVIADMTSANPNVFYELGVRHAAKPYTTIPLYASLGAPPFDVNMVRAIPYDLDNGFLGEAAADALKRAITARISRVLEGPVARDSPLFDLFPDFPGIEISHELTDVFRDRVEYSESVKQALATARAAQSRDEAMRMIAEIATQQGDPKLLERGVLVDIFLSYRAIEAWDEMVRFYQNMPGSVQQATLVKQQLALALNRRNETGDADRAISILEDLIEQRGRSAETLGILGRIHKDRYRLASEQQEIVATAYLDMAIEAYTQGFEAEPLDYYPGVNAINLLLQKGDEQAIAEIERLVPLVTFAAVRLGGADSKDYWTVATVMELASVQRDYNLAIRCLPRALALADEGWMCKTTADNLRLIASIRQDDENLNQITGLIEALDSAAKQRH